MVAETVHAGTNCSGCWEPAMTAARLVGVRRWRLNGVEISEATGTLTRDGVAVPLQKTPLAVLLYLLGRPGEVARDQDIEIAVWGKPVLGDSPLKTAIKKIRQAIGDHSQTANKTKHKDSKRQNKPNEQNEETPDPATRQTLEVGASPPQFPNWRLG